MLPKLPQNWHIFTSNVSENENAKTDRGKMEGTYKRHFGGDSHVTFQCFKKY
jgi:hypothetical protein